MMDDKSAPAFKSRESHVYDAKNSFVFSVKLANILSKIWVLTS